MRNEISERRGLSSRCRPLPLACALLASLVLAAPGYADRGGGSAGGYKVSRQGSDERRDHGEDGERQTDRAKLPEASKLPEAPKLPDLATNPETSTGPTTSNGPEAPVASHVSGDETSSTRQAAVPGTPAAATSSTNASSKAAAVASAVYVMRGRVVQVVAPSASAVGSVSFRVTASSRLATRLRGMVITLALTRPTTLRPGALVTVRLRAPADAMAHGFDSARALRFSGFA